MAQGEREALARVIPRLETDPDTGLSSEQVRARLSGGYANEKPSPPTKTVGQIFRDNILTYFNLVFVILGVCVALVGSYRNLTFLPVIFVNTAIGIVQELRSKRAVDRLTLLTERGARVIRDGREQTVPPDRTVRDDIVMLGAGAQIYADAVVLSGQCRVNESLITGEADEIAKRPGDELRSGSFVVSGEVRARLTNVGGESFAARLTIEAKKLSGGSRSRMKTALTKLIQCIGIIIFPVGVLLFLQALRAPGGSVESGVISAVAAMIGMIPQGLYLLMSVALAVSVVRLAVKRTLVRETACIENLARVDVLCVDKTGTVTEDKMTVQDIALLAPDRFIESDIRMIMADYVAAAAHDNETMAALGRFFTGKVRQRAMKTLPFSSERKYGGVSFAEDETYLLGAPELIMGERYGEISAAVEDWSEKGCRVLLLALYDGDLDAPGITAPVMPLALILLANKVRDSAAATFKYFADSGVEVKVISGDNPVTASLAAREAGIPGAENFIDATALNSERKIHAAALEYTVFGRVTPEQKRRLIKALKEQGRTVAMVGDGVNDVLAMRAADCSAAMASGSEVACQAAQVVLLDSDFSCMPAIVGEGRRVINNIERSASIYMVRNLYSFFIALILLVLGMVYPVEPVQMSYLAFLTIDTPSFLLALESNRRKVRGTFLGNVISAAAPAALADILLVTFLMLCAGRWGIEGKALSTSVVLIMAAVGFYMQAKVSLPFDRFRLVLIISEMAAFAVGAVLISGFLGFAMPSGTGLLCLLSLLVLAAPLAMGISFVQKKLLGLFGGARRKHC